MRPVEVAFQFFFSKTTSTGENLREAEEATSPWSQEGRAWDSKPNINIRRNPQDLTGVQLTPGGVSDHRRGPLHIRTQGLCPTKQQGRSIY